MHDWLVGLILEVAVPTRAEFLAWPAVHHLELFLGGSDLHTSVNTVGRQWASAINVPLVEDFFLNLWIASDEVIERLNTRLGAVGGKGEVMILEVETDAREVDERLDTRLAKLLGVTDTGTLEDEG